MKKVFAVVLLVAVVLAIATIAILRNGVSVSVNGKEVVALATSEPTVEWEFTPVTTATPVPTATPTPTPTPEPTPAPVIDDKGYQLFVGDSKAAMEFFNSMDFQEAVDFAANNGEYYAQLPEESEILKKDDETEWSVELLEWEEEVEVYRLGNHFPVAREDGSIVESSSEKSVATMSDRRASREAFCTTHKALRSSWVMHEVHVEAPNWLGTLKESAGFTPDLFGALVAYKATTTVEGQEVEGWRLAWRVCDCEYEQKQTASKPATSKPNGNKKPSATKKPSKPTLKPTATPTLKPTATPTAKPTATPTVKPTATPDTDHNPPSVTPEPTAKPNTEHNKPSVTVAPQATKAPALGEDAGTSSSGSGSSSASSHSKPSGGSTFPSSSSADGSTASSASSSASTHSKPSATAAPALGD